MPAPNPQHPVGLVEYLVSGTKQNEQRTTHIENDNHYGPWIDPVLLGNYVEADDPKRTVQYRWNYKAGKPDFRGYVNAYTATSGDIAFYIYSGFKLEHDISFLTDIQYSPTVTHIACVYIYRSDNSVTIRWPIT